jgi:hypothetical protein
MRLLQFIPDVVCALDFRKSRQHGVSDGLPCIFRTFFLLMLLLSFGFDAWAPLLKVFPTPARKNCHQPAFLEKCKPTQPAE